LYKGFTVFHLRQYLGRIMEVVAPDIGYIMDWLYLALW